MPEDFTTYTVGGAESAQISTTTTRCTATDLDRDDEAYCYDDKGANNFDGDFEHLCDVYITSADNLGISGIWALANAIGASDDLKSAGESYLQVFCYRDGNGVYNIRLIEYDYPNNYTDLYVCSVQTMYYLEIERDESVGTYGTLYCRIYSDAARTNLLDTLSLTLHSSKKDFRYVYGIMSRNYAVSVTQEISCYVENLDLQEVIVIEKIISQLFNNLSFKDKIISLKNGLKKYVSKTISSLYDIFSIVVKILSSKYNIKEYVSNILNIIWDSKKYIVREFNSIYNLLKFKLKKLKLQMNIKSIISKLLLSRHTLRELVTRLFSNIFNIKKYISKPISSIYSIFKRVSKSLSNKFNILKIIPKIVGLKYNTKATIQRILSSKFGLRAYIQKIISLIYTLGKFYIIDVTWTPEKIHRLEVESTTLRCDWHDEDDLADTDYTCQFWVRDQDNNTYGPYDGTVTKEGSKEYNATYSLDPDETFLLGRYDLKVEVTKYG